MKILLLTDVPPCTNRPDGLLLNQLCRFLPPGSLVCFATIDGALRPALDPELDWMPQQTVNKPGEFGLTSQHAALAYRAASTLREYLRRVVRVPALIDGAVRFGRQHHVDAVWAILQGQTTVRMARTVAERLRAPLFTQVGEPLSWWLKAHLVDPPNRLAAQAVFDAALVASVSCAVASDPMADAYSDRYGVKAVRIFGGLDPRLAHEPADAPREGHEIVIGIAGQLYDQAEWRQLLGALNASDWRVSGRSVRVQIYGTQTTEIFAPPGRVEHRGFVPQAELPAALNRETDILYCPYPYDTAMVERAKLSFPAKLCSYFASGRPVLFHGPQYSAPYQYIAESKAAVCSTRAEAPAVYAALQRLVSEDGLYARIAAAGADAFRKDFTLAAMKKSFFQFLGVDTERMIMDPEFSIRESAKALLASRFERAGLSTAGPKPRADRKASAAGTGPESIEKPLESRDAATASPQAAELAALKADIERVRIERYVLAARLARALDANHLFLEQSRKIIQPPINRSDAVMEGEEGGFDRPKSQGTAEGQSHTIARRSAETRDSASETQAAQVQAVDTQRKNQNKEG